MVNMIILNYLIRENNFTESKYRQSTGRGIKSHSIPNLLQFDQDILYGWRFILKINAHYGTHQC